MQFDKSYSYEELFAAASEVIGEPITDMITYFSHIDELRKTGIYKFIRLPINEKPFIIDLDTRKIAIPEDFDRNGIGVQGDSLAEILYFQMPRFFDDMDLSTCFSEETEDNRGNTYIRWENGRGDQGKDPAKFAEIGPDYIIFGWPLHDAVMYAFKEGVTSGTSTVKFSVHCEYREEEKEDSKVLFSLHTLSASCKIHANLIDPKKSLQIEDISDQLVKRPAFSGIFDSVNGAKAYIVKDLPSFANYDIADDGTTQTVLDEDGNPVLSIEATGEGLGLVYQWFKGTEPIKEATEASYTVTDGLGAYFVKVGNAYAPNRVRWTESNTTNIVGPSELNIVKDLVRYGYADGVTALDVDVEVLDDGRRVPNGTQTYTWYRNNQVIEGATSDSYTPAIDEPGEYHMSVINEFNRAQTKPITSSTILLKAPVRAPRAVTAVYDAESNILTANVDIDFANDLYYRWMNTNPEVMGTYGPFTEPTFVPTTNGSYQCEVYQHCFADMGDSPINQVSGSTHSNVITVNNAE